MSQISYLNELGGLTAGMRGDVQFDYKRSYLNNTGAIVPFGVGVFRGATDGVLKRGTAITDDFIGIVGHSHIDNSSSSAYPPSAVPFGTATPQAGVPNTAQANVIRAGMVWAQVEQAVTPDDRVFVRITANGPGKDVLGAFRKDADLLSGVPTAVPVAGLSFMSTALAAGVALIEVTANASTRLGASPGGSAARIVLTPRAEAANVINVDVALFDDNGVPVAVATPIYIESFAVTDSGGDLAAASASPLGTVVKALNPATGPNTMSMTSTAAGLAAFGVTNAAAEITDVRVTVGNVVQLLRLTFA